MLAAAAAVCNQAAEGGCAGGVAATGLRCRSGSISFAAFALASASLSAAIGMDSCQSSAGIRGTQTHGLACTHAKIDASILNGTKVYCCRKYCFWVRYRPSTQLADYIKAATARSQWPAAPRLQMSGRKAGTCESGRDCSSAPRLQHQPHAFQPCPALLLPKFTALSIRSSLSTVSHCTQLSSYHRPTLALAHIASCSRRTLRALHQRVCKQRGPVLLHAWQADC